MQWIQGSIHSTCQSHFSSCTVIFSREAECVLDYVGTPHNMISGNDLWRENRGSVNRQDMSLEEKKVKLIVSVYIQSSSQVDATK